MQYEEKILKSGHKISIRPQTWEEYWLFSEEQSEGLLLMEKESEGLSNLEKNIAAIKAHKNAREQLLTTCLEDWNKFKSILSIRDVVEIEKIIKEISTEDVESGN